MVYLKLIWLVWFISIHQSQQLIFIVRVSRLSMPICHLTSRYIDSSISSSSFTLLLLFFFLFFYFLLISVISFLNKLILLRLQLVFTWYCFFILIFVRLKKIGKNFYFWFCFLLLLFIILNCQYKEQLVLRDRIFLWISNIWKIHFLRIDIFDSNYNKEFFCV